MLSQPAVVFAGEHETRLATIDHKGIWPTVPQRSVLGAISVIMETDWVMPRNKVGTSDNELMRVIL